jgi:SH3 domain protein
VNKLMTMVLLAVFSVPSLAQQFYVADKLFTYMHSGPSAQYRIIGSVDAGDKVKPIKTDRDSGYTQIVDEKGREGWVQSKFITSTESMAVRLPRLEKELAEVKAKLASAEGDANRENAELAESLDLRSRQVNELEQNYSEMMSKFSQAQGEIRELSAKLDTQKEDLLMKYFLYGGGVMLGGIFFGIILPHIIPKRRKNRSDWV